MVSEGRGGVNKKKERNHPPVPQARAEAAEARAGADREIQHALAAGDNGGPLIPFCF